MNLFFKILICLLIILFDSQISVGQNDKNIVGTDTLKSKNDKKEKRHRLFSKTDKNDSTEIKENGQIKSNINPKDSANGNQTVKKSPEKKKSNKELSKEGRRKKKVQEKYNRKLVRLTKKCTLSNNEKMLLNKSKGMKLSPGETRICKRAEKKMDKYDRKSKLYEKKRHFEIQDKKTQKMINRNRKNSDNSRRNHKKFNRNNGIFSNEKD